MMVTRMTEIYHKQINNCTCTAFRSEVNKRYNLFTRRKHGGKSFEDWYCEPRRLFDLSEATQMSVEDLLTELINTGIKDDRV